MDCTIGFSAGGRLSRPCTTRSSTTTTTSQDRDPLYFYRLIFDELLPELDVDEMEIMPDFQLFSDLNKLMPTFLNLVQSWTTNY